MDHFFVLGCPRSGTTMLQQALNRHSQIVIPPETKFFYYLYGRSRACAARHVERLNGDLGIGLVPPAEPVRTAGEGRALFAEMARQYLQRLGRDGVAWFGDKTPEHTSHAERIREVFPAAKFIAISRDGRDVALSLSKMPWIECNPYVGMLIWNHYQRAVRRLREDTAIELHHVRYEDLVAEPQRELTGILRFLDLDYEPPVAEGYGNREGIPERELAWKSRALEPIRAERTGNWRRELSGRQIQWLEHLGGRELTREGYALVGANGTRFSPALATALTWGLSRLVLHLPMACLAQEITACVPRRVARNA
jgi:hypothetical protein